MNKLRHWLLLLCILPALACNLNQGGQPPLVFPTSSPSGVTQPPAAQPPPTGATAPAATVPANPAQTPAPAASLSPAEAAQASATAYRTRTARPSATARPPTGTPKPICSVISNVRLRQLPSTDANWIRTLLAGELLTPLEYIPVGPNGGEWLKVQVQASQETGWVTANTQVVACNLDVRQLQK